MADEFEKWLNSKKPARLGGLQVRPRANPRDTQLPLCEQRGQAQAYYLLADGGRAMILKRFLTGRKPDRKYTEAIRHVLPKHPAFESGNGRQVLTPNEVEKGNGLYWSSEFAADLDGCILMPRVSGESWASLADNIRSAAVTLDDEKRLAICRALSDAVDLLEARGCAHRDLSSGNVFVDSAAWSVALIDFDCLFHDTLSLPATTTSGSPGYTAPFVWKNGNPDPAVTWCPKADRFSLALLNAEFLAMEPNAPLKGDGGLFDQDHIRARRGSTIAYVETQLGRKWPGARDAFRRALLATVVDACPSPKDWIAVCDAIGTAQLSGVRLSGLEPVRAQDFADVLSRRQKQTVGWKAPRLTELTQGLCVCASTKPRARTRRTVSQPRKSRKCETLDVLKYWFYGS